MSKKDNKSYRISCRLTDYEYKIFLKLMKKENKNITQLMSKLITSQFNKGVKNNG